LPEPQLPVSDICGNQGGINAAPAACHRYPRRGRIYAPLADTGSLAIRIYVPLADIGSLAGFKPGISGNKKAATARGLISGQLSESAG